MGMCGHVTPFSVTPRLYLAFPAGNRTATHQPAAACRPTGKADKLFSVFTETKSKAFMV